VRDQPVRPRLDDAVTESFFSSLKTERTARNAAKAMCSIAERFQNP
jgi:hypothetical protein